MGVTMRIFTMLLLSMGILDAAEVKDGKLVEYVRKRVHDNTPTKAERKFDQIAWADGLAAAMRLGKQHGRPILVFVYDGNLSTARC
jgi:hypothetical protein